MKTLGIQISAMLLGYYGCLAINAGNIQAMIALILMYFLALLFFNNRIAP